MKSHSKNTSIINLDTYIILWDVLIGFAVFALFFTIFTNYFFMSYQNNLIVDMFKTNIGIYENLDKDLKKIILNNETVQQDIIELEQKSKIKQIKVDKHNKKYEDLFISIVVSIVGGFALLLLLPLFLGYISYKEVPVLYLLGILACHMIFILGFELLIFFKGVYPKVITVNIYAIIEKMLSYINY